MKKVKIVNSENFLFEIIEYKGEKALHIVVKTDELSSSENRGNSALELKTRAAEAFNNIRKNPFEEIIINLENVRYLDSGGLAAILNINSLLRNNVDKKDHLMMYGLENAVERLIAISQLDSIFYVWDNLVVALESFVQIKAAKKAQLN